VIEWGYPMSRIDDFQVRTMRRDELSFAIGLAAKEGWNPGLHDAECFFAADPNGFLIGELGGERVGCISAVSYAERYGFVGLYIVRPEYRGKGYGMRLWQAAMDRLHGHNIGLDGVVAQQGNYARSGFRLAYRNIRYRVQAEPMAIHASIAPADAVAFDAIRDFDRQIFPETRDAFLRHWLAQPLARAYVARDGGVLTGYTVIRHCREGWKIGPLAAEDALTARRLFDAAAAHAGAGEAILIDVPEPNLSSASFLSAPDVIQVFESARMYTGPDPEIMLSKMFGVTTLELG
jgi:GNAT superfamily N-acetyltransferase